LKNPKVSNIVVRVEPEIAKGLDIIIERKKYEGQEVTRSSLIRESIYRIFRENKITKQDLQT